MNNAISEMLKKIISTSNESVYLRIGDKTRENATANEITDHTGRSINTVRKRINHLLELEIIAENDSTNSPRRSYYIDVKKQLTNFW